MCELELRATGLGGGGADGGATSAGPTSAGPTSAGPTGRGSASGSPHPRVTTTASAATAASTRIHRILPTARKALQTGVFAPRCYRPRLE